MTNEGPETPNPAGNDYDNTQPHYPAGLPDPADVHAVEHAAPPPPGYGYDAPRSPFAPPSGQPVGQQAPLVPGMASMATTPPLPLSGHSAGRGRKRFAAGVLAAALVVGGGAGVGGAAVWGATHDNGSTSSAFTTKVSSASKDVPTSADPAADGTVEAVAAKVLPSVVKIEVSGAQGSGSGSGIILNATGQILTNNHVVELASGGGTLSVSFNDGTSAPATVVGTDPLTDTALIQATGVSGLTPATIGTSGDLAVGQGVVAIGSPFGLESTVTSGIVSALNRPVDVGSDAAGNTTTYPAIQTDAAINPGNSGGALTDMAGNVVGINASIRTAGSTTTGEESGSIGLGFAIPIDEVMPIIEQMAAGETPTHARLGVKVGDVGADANGAPVSDGAAVKAVDDGSTAAAGGIAAGDVITKVDGTIITGADSLVATVRSYRPGDKVTVTYTHDGATKTADLTLDSDATTS